MSLRSEMESKIMDACKGEVDEVEMLQIALDVLIPELEKAYTWEGLKQRGSSHYKTGDVEPIDLIRAGGMLTDFCLANIIKYAFRSRETDVPTALKNLEKIRHYADMLTVDLTEGRK